MARVAVGRLQIMPGDAIERATSSRGMTWPVRSLASHRPKVRAGSLLAISTSHAPLSGLYLEVITA